MDCDTHDSNSGLFIVQSFLQINFLPNLLSYQEYRDADADQIGDRLGGNDTVVAEQGIVHNNDADEHHALPSQGKNGGTLGVAGGLHQTGADPGGTAETERKRTLCVGRYCLKSPGQPHPGIQNLRLGLVQKGEFSVFDVVG